MPDLDQKKGVKWLLEHAAAALWADPGVGKTAINLAAFKVLKKKRVADRMLVLAPLRPCHMVWPAELRKWEDFCGLTFEVLHGDGKDEALRRDADIYICNFDGLEWLTQVDKVKLASGRTRVSMDMRRWRRLGFDTLAIDELSKLKNTGTDRFKVVKMIVPTFARRWGGTGSPAAKNLMGLFGQCYALDEGRTFGPYITHFRQKYFDCGFDGYSWTLKSGADQQIYDRVRPLALRLEAKDRPEVVVNNVMIELPPAVRKIYDALEDDMIAKIEAQTVVAVNAGVASMKCRQVANGGIYLDPDVMALVKGVKADREWVNLHTEKVDALADMVDELQGEPLLVAYEFKHDLARLKKKFGEDVPVMGGGNIKRDTELEALWNKGKLPLLLGHPASIGHGLNLQEFGRHVAWHSMTYDYELYEQFIDRIRRRGNKHKQVFVHHFMAKDTVDDRAILPSLNAKERGQNALYDALKNLRRRK